MLAEIEEAKKAYPEAYIRVMVFDNVRQVQVAGFIAQRPALINLVLLAVDVNMVAEGSNYVCPLMYNSI